MFTFTINNRIVELHVFLTRRRMLDLVVKGITVHSESLIIRIKEAYGIQGTKEEILQIMDDAWDAYINRNKDENDSNVESIT